MVSKRPVSSQSQSQSTASTVPSQPHEPPPKRQKLAPPSAAPSSRPEDKPVPYTPAVANNPPAAATPPLPPVQKRAHYPGSLRRLALSRPTTGPGTVTLSGAKIGGKSKDLNRVGPLIEDMWVRRGDKGLNFPGYLKKGVASFLERGCTALTVHGMGAAIPFALSVALAIRDALPGGTYASDDEGAVKMEVRTGTVEVQDEITPDDEAEDILYQTRSKSTVEVVLSLRVPIGINRVEVPRGSGGGRGGRGGRGGSGKGPGRGRGTGRGRGRGAG